MLDGELLKLIKNCYDDYLIKLTHYEDINRYYYGNTDSLKNFTPRPGRSNLKTNTNFVQKLVDEESQYSFGNKITYSSSERDDVVKTIEYNLKNNKEDHDINLGRGLINFGVVFEINYIDKKKKFRNKVIKPLNGYVYLDEDDDPFLFLHIFKKKFSDKMFIDVYTDNLIYHFNESFVEISEPSEHYFGVVPVGVGIVGGKLYTEERGYIEGDKTIYRTIKTIQDAFETNLSDMVCEISDFRNAILKLFGIELEDELDDKGNPIIDSDGNIKKKQPVIRDNTVLCFGEKGIEDAEWLIKNINDTFIKNTRDDLKDLIYSLTSHIDNNEKMQSNLSGMALRTRMNSLESKCSDNEKALTNIIKTRLYCLSRYLYLIKSSEAFDPNMVDVKYTAKIPIDDAAMADVASKLAPTGIVSKKKLRTQLSFVTDSDAEAEQIKKELAEELPKENLDNLGDDTDE